MQHHHHQQQHQYIKTQEEDEISINDIPSFTEYLQRKLQISNRRISPPEDINFVENVKNPNFMAKNVLKREEINNKDNAISSLATTINPCENSVKPMLSTASNASTINWESKYSEISEFIHLNNLDGKKFLIQDRVDKSPKYRPNNLHCENLLISEEASKTKFYSSNSHIVAEEGIKMLPQRIQNENMNIKNLMQEKVAQERVVPNLVHNDINSTMSTTSSIILETEISEINENYPKKTKWPLPSQQFSTRTLYQYDPRYAIKSGMQYQTTKNKGFHALNRINLELFLKWQNHLAHIIESFSFGNSLFESCEDYIHFSIKKDHQEFEKIFSSSKHRRTLLKSFILEKLSIFILVYLILENKNDENNRYKIKNLILMAYENYITLAQIIYSKILDKQQSNVWIVTLKDLIAKNSSNMNMNLGTIKDENMQKIANNINIMLKIIESMLKIINYKSMHYGFNSILLQLDTIKKKDAYERLSSLFQIYICEKNLKAQKDMLNGMNSIKTLNQNQFYFKPTKPKSDDKTPIKPIQPKDTPIQTFEIIDLPPSSPTIITTTTNNPNISTITNNITYSINKPHPKLTLVVDLDETLVHYTEIGQYGELRVRPYVDYFLSELSKLYEIIIFTAATQEYADWAIDYIDKGKVINHRFYRQHTTTEGFNFIKDLSKIGRDLSKIIIIDNIPENFKLQPDNGIFIKPWYDDPDDTALLELTPILKQVGKKRVKDVRQVLKTFREQMLKNIENGIENPHLHVNLDLESDNDDE